MHRNAVPAGLGSMRRFRESPYDPNRRAESAAAGLDHDESLAKG
jgi:hypothetical protein